MLAAPLQLYTWQCRSEGRSVCLSVGLSVGRSVHHLRYGALPSEVQLFRGNPRCFFRQWNFFGLSTLNYFAKVLVYMEHINCYIFYFPSAQQPLTITFCFFFSNHTALIDYVVCVWFLRKQWTIIVITNIYKIWQWSNDIS